MEHIIVRRWEDLFVRKKSKENGRRKRFDGTLCSEWSLQGSAALDPKDTLIVLSFRPAFIEKEKMA